MRTMILEGPKIIAAILAGGFGTRLRPVVSNEPKVLATVCHRPFIYFILDQLIAAKIEFAVLCIGYLGEKIRSILGGKYRSLHLEYSHETKPLGTAGALRLALPLFGSNPVMVMNGDSYFGADLEKFYNQHHMKKSTASLMLAQVSDTRRYGRVKLAQDGTITRFEEKGKSSSGGWINAGIYLLEPCAIESIPEYRPVSLETEMFPQWIGKRLYGFSSDGRFIDIGTPSAYTAAQEFFKRNE